MADLNVTVGADVAAYNAAMNSAAASTQSFSTQASRSLAQATEANNSFGGSAMSTSMRLQQMRSGLSAARDGIVGFSVGGQQGDRMLMTMGHHINSLINETGSLKGAFVALGQSLIGPGGIILGITLVVELYKHFEKASKEASEATKEYAETLTAVRQAQLKGDQDGKTEITRLQILYQATRNSTLSLKDRNAAYDELASKYPKFFNNADREKTLLGQNTEAYEKLTTAILQSAMAKAYEDKIGTNTQRYLENEQKLLDVVKEEIAARSELTKIKPKADSQRTLQSNIIGGSTLAINTTDNSAIDKEAGLRTKLNEIIKRKNDLLTDNSKIQKQNEDLAQKATDSEISGGFKTMTELDGKVKKTNKIKSGFAALQEELNKAESALQDSIIAGKTSSTDYDSPLVAKVRKASEALEKFKTEYADLLRGQISFTQSSNNANPNDIFTPIDEKSESKFKKGNDKSNVGVTLNQNAKELADNQRLYDSKLITAQSFYAKKYFLEESNLNAEQSLYDSDSKEFAQYTLKKLKLTEEFLKNSKKSNIDLANAELVANQGAQLLGNIFSSIGKGENVFSGLISGIEQLLIKLAAAIAEAAIFALIMDALGFGSFSSLFLGEGGSGGAFKSFTGFTIPGHADGGITLKPHLAMVGEGGENEVIAPLSKLKSMMGNSGSMTHNVVVTGKISGNDLKIVGRRTDASNSRRT